MSKGKVIVGMSGGVDSSVAAVLLSKAVGKQLTCVFVDSAILRIKDFTHIDQISVQFKKRLIIRYLWFICFTLFRMTVTPGEWVYDNENSNQQDYMTCLHIY